MPKQHVQAKVVQHIAYNEDVRAITLFAPSLVRDSQPGQFIHVRVTEQYHPLLRRPISICDIDHEQQTMTLVYRIIGEGTRLLAAVEPGGLLDCMGPLGNGFILQGNRPLLVGGGMGVAPLVYLARMLCPQPVEVLLGARSKQEMFWPELFAAVCKNIHITTDDGSLGTRGNTIDVLPQLIQTGNYDMIYTCGPNPMMRGVVEQAQKYDIPCQISLEKHMACGVGACLSCTCGASDGKRRKVCTDGPVFWAGEVTEW